ncbi:MAG: hypothetical protein GY801_00190 [bacterium]|nr:hypothetical protein [bacterium]
MKNLQNVVPTVLNRLNIKTAVSRIMLPALCVVLILVAGGCTNPTSSPTQPEVDPAPLSPTEEPDNPTEDPPDKELTPEPDGGTCDNFADNREDYDLPLLPTDGTPILVSMECAGDVDWYVIDLLESPVKLEILLSGIAEGDDFDLKLYDSQFVELEDGRSSQSGSNDEMLSLIVDGSRLYLQVYAFNGRGEAALEVIAGQEKELVEEDVEEEPDAEPNTDPESGDGSEGEEELIEQLSYEDLLNTTFWFYPRGDSSDLLERSNEKLVVQSIYCQLSDVGVWGELTIGNFAHVERDLLESVDYIDGWGLVVFKGSKSVLERLSITIRVSILGSGRDTEVELPIEMELDGSDYIASKRREGVYYLSSSYGDLSGKSDADLKVSSGVVGEFGEASSSAIFEQQVEVEWAIEDSQGILCSGQALGDSIRDFELGNYLRALQ